MKKILLKIGVLSFVVGIIVFIPQANLVTSKIKAATITLEEATKAIDDLGIEFKHDTKGKNQRNLAISIYKDAIENNEKQAVAKERAARGVISNMNTDLSKEGRWEKNPDGKWEFKENKIQDRNDIAYLDIVNAHKIPQSSAIKQVKKACPQEGIEGVDFLVFHGPLVPCGISKQCDASNITDSKIKQRIEELSKPCTICHFIILIKNVFDLLLSMIITASLFMLTIAGVLYIVSSGGQMTGIAKGIIEKTLLGFGIFLLSWLIVYTLLNMLSVRENVIGKGTADSWFQFTCDTQSRFYKESDGAGEGTGTGGAGEGTGTGGAGEGTGTGGAGEGTGTGGSQNTNLGGNPNVTPPDTSSPEEQARAALFEDSGGNISVWESKTGATNIRDIRPVTRERLLAFQKESGIPLTVTGGAEAGYHAGDNNTTAQSHINGYKVDIDDTPAVNNYIENNYTYVGYRAGKNGGRVYTDGRGNYYTREDTHWDVCYNCNSPAISTRH